MWGVPPFIPNEPLENELHRFGKKWGREGKEVEREKQWQ